MEPVPGVSTSTSPTSSHGALTSRSAMRTARALRGLPSSVEMPVALREHLLSVDGEDSYRRIFGSADEAQAAVSDGR
jgi:hypothetical protein